MIVIYCYHELETPKKDCFVYKAKVSRKSPMEI